MNMSIETVIQELADFNANYKKVREEFVKKLVPQFAEVFEQFFAENPNVGGVVWTQYTPYFNDGDECVFRVSGKYLFPTSTDLDDLSGYDEDLFPSFDDIKNYVYVLENDKAPANYRTWYDADAFKRTFGATKEQHILDVAQTAGLNKGNVVEFYKTLNDWEKLQDTLASIDDDIYKDIFGDHAKIVVTRDGINVDEYSHD
jgi:hypothetical protein